MNATLSQTAKDYLRDLRRHLTSYSVDGATSAALLADARDGLTGLDDDAAAYQIDRLGWPEEVAKNAAQEQEPVLQRKDGISLAAWACLAVALIALVLAFTVPFVGIGVAIAALIWAIWGFGREPENYRAIRWVAVGALVVNVVTSVVLLVGLFMFMTLSEPVEVEEGTPVPVGSGVSVTLVDGWVR